MLSKIKRTIFDLNIPRYKSFKPHSNFLHSVPTLIDTNRNQYMNRLILSRKRLKVTLLAIIARYGVTITYYYQPQVKLREVNVFTPICQSVYRRVFVRGSLCPGGSLPGKSLSGEISVRGDLCLGESLSRGVSVGGDLCPGESLSGGISVRGISVRGSLCPGDLCPGESLSGGSLSGRVSVRGDICPGESLSGGISVQGSLCPGGSLSGGVSVRGDLCPGESLSEGISVRGSLCAESLSRGLSPERCLSRRPPPHTPPYGGRVGGTHPTGMHICL